MADHVTVRPSSASSPFLQIPILSGRAMTIVLHSVQLSIKHGTRRVLVRDRIMV